LDFLEIAKKSTVDGETCLHLTAISNDFEIAKLMIELGADVSARVTHTEVRISEMPFACYRSLSIDAKQGTYFCNNIE